MHSSCKCYVYQEFLSLPTHTSTHRGNSKLGNSILLLHICKMNRNISSLRHRIICIVRCTCSVISLSSTELFVSSFQLFVDYRKANLSFHRLNKMNNTRLPHTWCLLHNYPNPQLSLHLFPRHLAAAVTHGQHRV